ncbi:MAG: nucleoside monophosphate kinase, partial [Candidatus Cloacimonadaceae bacterium]|nr:nucleoside monophosphate kinase [Candidatus Cloacimonadaceae bacterium]
ANYNLIGQAPKVDGVCDVCGGELTIRQDDKPEAIKQRVHEFYQQTFKLQDFFAAKNLLTTFNANLSIDDLAKQIARELQFD